MGLIRPGASLPAVVMMLLAGASPPAWSSQLESPTAFPWPFASNEVDGPLKTTEAPRTASPSTYVPVGACDQELHASHNSLLRRKRQDLLTAPSSLRVVSAGRDYVDLEWQHDGPGGAMEFLVKVYYTGGAFAKDQVSRGTSVRVGGLAPGTDYTFSVMAFLPLPNGRRAQSPESSLASAKTQDIVLPAPTNLRVTETTLQYIDLEWQYDSDVTDVEFLVKVYYRGGDFVKDQVTRGTSVRVGDLAPITDYNLSVTAIKSLPRGLRAESAASEQVSARTGVMPTQRTTTRPTAPSTSPQPATTPTSTTSLPFRPATDPVVASCGEDGMCSCPPPNEHFCVSCSRINSCEKLNDEDVCSRAPESEEINMTISILSCGAKTIVNVEGIVRSNGDFVCGSARGVPVDTVVMAECWGTTTLLAQCHADGKWHPYGSHQEQAPASRHLCQAPAINSPECGIRSRHTRPPGQGSIQLVALSQWNWLVGIFIREKFRCTATLITPEYLLTAAHCITRTQETSTETVDVRNIKVQHMNTTGRPTFQFVRSVHAFPGFMAGKNPFQDLGLIRLEHPVTFSYHVQPACLIAQRLPTNKIAATFMRMQNHFQWKLVLQSYDSRCDGPRGACLSVIKNYTTQFCASDFEPSPQSGDLSSGGPYLVNVGTAVREKWVVAGVVSYRTDLCQSSLTIFTSVVDFWPWISRCVHEGKCS
ncbi:serine protease svh-1 isoform X2 [Procambarus clarkii]|uniref:serine protease svh-1 isoform X2 n=1 Tax=Procambarus clarkii TaxID=6728 RepID=UPI001E675535|nr:uncharacterized protein LOC123771293 isoform X2 [Procambarus clarkii]